MALDYRPEDASRAADPQQLLDWRNGWQVVDPAGGSNLVTAGTGNFEYDAASGDINAGGTIVSCTQQTVDLSTDADVPDADDSSMVIIYRDSSGGLQFEVGTLATRDPSGEDVRSSSQPPAPTLYDVDGVVLAEVLVPAGASSVGASELRDRRLGASLDVDQLTGQDVDVTNATVATAPTASTDVARKAELDNKSADPHGNAAHSPNMVEQGGPLNETLDASDERIENASAVDTATLEVQNVDEARTTVDPANGTVTLDVDASNVKRLEADGDITVAFSNVNADPPVNSLVAYFNDSAGGPHNLTWPASVIWDGNSSTDQVANESNVEVSLLTDDGGSEWRARESGSGFE